MDQALLEARVTVEDPDVACTVVDNVLLLHLLNCNRAVVYDVGLSTAQGINATSSPVSPRPSNSTSDQCNLVEAAS